MIRSMSMAMVCAQLSLFGPSVGATHTKSHSKCTLASSSAGLQVFRAEENYREGYTSLACRASSGGSRRDYEKILARQQKRRVRHMKGVTPSTPDLVNTLDSEKRDQAKLDSFPDPANDDRERNVHNSDDEGHGEEGVLLPFDGAAMLSPNLSRASHVDDGHVAAHIGREDNEELSDDSEGTAGAGAGAECGGVGE